MFNNMQMGAGNDKETQIKFRRYMTIMDSMTEKELDENDVRKLFEPPRIKRYAYGSGRSIVRSPFLYQCCSLHTLSFAGRDPLFACNLGGLGQVCGSCRPCGCHSWNGVLKLYKQSIQLEQILNNFQKPAKENPAHDDCL